MAIYVEVGFVTMHALAYMVRKPANRKDVRAAIESQGIIRAEPFPCQHLIADHAEAWIIRLKCVRRHHLNDTSRSRLRLQLP